MKLTSSDGRRRWWGSIFLGLSVIMLVWGQTALKPYLAGMNFIFYWVVCMLFTFMALMTAMLDFWIIRRRGRGERINLLRKTFSDIDPEELAAKLGKDGPSADELRRLKEMARSEIETEEKAQTGADDK